MCSRFKFYTYIWNGLHFSFLQAEILEAVLAYYEQQVDKKTKQFDVEKK